MPALQNAVLWFWSWWYGELAAVFAPFCRFWRPGRAAGTPIRLTRGEAGEGEAASGQSVTMEADSWHVLAQGLKAAGRDGRPLILDLAEDLVLRRHATYPVGALAKLDDIVALDIEKSTPFSRDTAVWKWHVTSRSGGMADVETVVLRRDLVLSVLSLASKAGLVVGEIVFSAMPGQRALQLLKLETPTDRSRIRWRRANAGLLCLVLLLAAAVGGVSYWKRQGALEVANAQLADVKARAIRLRRAQAEAVAEYDASVALMREKMRTPSVNLVWNALSEALPDTVFLSALELTGQSGRISGFARSAAPLIERLEGLDQLSDVTFASPVMINPDDRLERFDITFTLAPDVGDLAAAPATQGARHD